MSDKLPTMPWDALKTRCVELEARVGELAAALRAFLAAHDLAGSESWDGSSDMRAAFDNAATNAQLKLSGSPAPVRQAQQAVFKAAMAIWQANLDGGLADEEALMEACDAYAKLREPEQEAEG